MNNFKGLHSQCAICSELVYRCEHVFIVYGLERRSIKPIDMYINNYQETRYRTTLLA